MDGTSTLNTYDNADEAQRAADFEQGYRDWRNGGASGTGIKVGSTYSGSAASPEQMRIAQKYGGQGTWENVETRKNAFGIQGLNYVYRATAEERARVQAQEDADDVAAFQRYKANALAGWDSYGAAPAPMGSTVNTSLADAASFPTAQSIARQVASLNFEPVRNPDGGGFGPANDPYALSVIDPRTMPSRRGGTSGGGSGWDGFDPKTGDYQGYSRTYGTSETPDWRDFPISIARAIASELVRAGITGDAIAAAFARAGAPLPTTSRPAPLTNRAASGVTSLKAA
jgi:hypothetical protein